MSLLPQEIVRRKRDKNELNPEELHAVVQGICDGNFSEAQISAFAMAVFLNGMEERELVTFTKEVTNSGKVLRWDDLSLGGPVLDKHSTGGVGDKVSLPLAPIIAACGGFMPMIAGRGLGHTGGTVDKLEVIPGYRTDVSIEKFRQTVKEIGCAIIGQTADLAPADRRLYAIRDVTGTVESIPLITCSILSKKLAAGLQGLAMDVKVGRGAFMADVDSATALGKSLAKIGRGAGLPITVLISDMNEVLGTTVGNALEMDESVRYLAGGSVDSRFHELTIDLAAEMLVLGRLADNVPEARAKAEHALHSGKAAEIFEKMVAALGGPKDYVLNYGKYRRPAKKTKSFNAPRDGYITSIDVRGVGIAAIGLGGGRTKTTDEIDLTVGFSDVLPVGRSVQAGDPLALVHAASDESADQAIAALSQAFNITDTKPDARPVVVSRFSN